MIERRRTAVKQSHTQAFASCVEKTQRDAKASAEEAERETWSRGEAFDHHRGKLTREEVEPRTRAYV